MYLVSSRMHIDNMVIKKQKQRYDIFLVPKNHGVLIIYNFISVSMPFPIRRNARR